MTKINFYVIITQNKGDCLMNYNKYVEEFFINMAKAKFCERVSYLEMPTNDCFSFCLKEILYVLDLKSISEKTRDYTKKIYSNFYQFMLEDKIFKSKHDFEYRNLMLKLKNYSEGDANTDSVVQQKVYFQKLQRNYTREYKNECRKIILDLYNNKLTYSDKNIAQVFDIFFNELLANKMDYKFIDSSIKMYDEGNFKDFPTFIDYLYYSNKDTLEIYIPIKNTISKDIEFLSKNGQEIIKKEGPFYYCKTQANDQVDYISFIKKQLLRIESIFNTLRLYTTSSIEFDFDGNVIIKSSFFQKNMEIKFKDIVTYENKFVNFKYLNRLLISLNKLKETDDELKDVDDEYKISSEIKENKNIRLTMSDIESRKNLYYKILNILSFAEKDKDLLNYNSFIDNWTALETLCSLNNIKKGYDAVEFIVPKIISSKLVLNDLRDADIRDRGFISENFAEKFVFKSKTQKFKFNVIKNSYSKYKCQKYSEIFDSMNKLKEYLYHVEKRIEMDILRIYIIRNEYTHNSNLNIFNSMQQYKLKTLLPFCLDEVFRTLNDIIDTPSYSEGISFDIFNDLLLKHQMRERFFYLIDNNVRIKNGGIDLKINIEQMDITESGLMFNILKNNLDITKKIGKQPMQFRSK